MTLNKHLLEMTIRHIFTTSGILTVLTTHHDAYTSQYLHGHFGVSNDNNDNNRILYPLCMYMG